MTKEDTQVPGFRKGMTKKKLMNSLSDEDWQHIDQMKEAQERKLENKWAYNLLVRSEQGYKQFFSLKRDAQKHLAHTLALKQTLDKNKKALLAEDVALADSEEVADLRDVEVENLQLQNNIETLISLTRHALSKLYPFVGSKRLDGEIMMNDDQYNEFVESISDELNKSNLSLL